ncbi:MAG: electron transport complex subunit RsxC [endosymbiont of Galathealinum brachiosum]|uniref:Ion-translocating oxidoreductase complex subunit C n=1 Tax=endosymbiont of Galathealinum brachiosum TaxID=2200906 RepID=A0A370D9C6_9GAMM|nr:MAG: electron transport complex subunit RsxC [endosymbiont of Galathealinum brachiosum]
MTRSSQQLWHFHGGLKLDSNKAMSTSAPIVKANMPKRLVLPVQQHIGEAGQLLVTIGDRVLKGQPVTESTEYISAPIHAPTSGTIIDIDKFPAPHPSGLNTLCVVIEPDGEDKWVELETTLYPNTKSPSELRQIIRNAGIVGLGGAAFPTAVKVNQGPGAHIETLIINGAECEPYISCDDMQMREYANELISGCEIIQYIISATHCLIAIEDNKPEAITAIETVIKEKALHTIEVVRIPTLYPTGGEKQLIKVLTQKEVPSDGFPSDIGLLVQNVGTAVAVHNAVVRGEPLISRIVTITGDGVNQPQNMEVLFGTFISELIEQSGGYHEDASKLIMGGPMMGFTLQTDHLPVIKGSNCILVENTPIETPATMPCIRCGACAAVCPAQLLPQQLFWMASSKNFDLVQDYHLFDCIECGCCAQVCPSQIPLVQYYRFAKTEIWNQERDKIKSDHARVRHDFKQARLDREKIERAEKLRKKKELLEKKKMAEAAAKKEEGDNEVDPKKAAIEAAMKRVQDKKAAKLASKENIHEK